mmetsp:Transcript_93379/g.250063  ORF Transcript_93379/g.250063 Transcript_93379/m.250063 type:complete len:894 (+) Transcript_93379:28-2709(+)
MADSLGRDILVPVPEGCPNDGAARKRDSSLKGRRHPDGKRPSSGQRRPRSGGARPTSASRRFLDGFVPLRPQYGIFANTRATAERSTPMELPSVPRWPGTPETAEKLPPVAPYRPVEPVAEVVEQNREDRIKELVGLLEHQLSETRLMGTGSTNSRLDRTDEVDSLRAQNEALAAKCQALQSQLATQAKREAVSTRAWQLVASSAAEERDALLRLDRQRLQAVSKLEAEVAQLKAVSAAKDQRILELQQQSMVSQLSPRPEQQDQFRSRAQTFEYDPGSGASWRYRPPSVSSGPEVSSNFSQAHLDQLAIHPGNREDLAASPQASMLLRQKRDAARGTRAQVFATTEFDDPEEGPPHPGLSQADLDRLCVTGSPQHRDTFVESERMSMAESVGAPAPNLADYRPRFPTMGSLAPSVAESLALPEASRSRMNTIGSMVSSIPESEAEQAMQSPKRRPNPPGIETQFGTGLNEAPLSQLQLDQLSRPSVTEEGMPTSPQASALLRTRRASAKGTVSLEPTLGPTPPEAQLPVSQAALDILCPPGQPQEYDEAMSPQASALLRRKRTAKGRNLSESDLFGAAPCQGMTQAMLDAMCIQPAVDFEGPPDTASPQASAMLRRKKQAAANAQATRDEHFAAGGLAQSALDALCLQGDEIESPMASSLQQRKIAAKGVRDPHATRPPAAPSFSPGPPPLSGAIKPQGLDQAELDRLCVTDSPKQMMLRGQDPGESSSPQASSLLQRRRSQGSPKSVEAEPWRQTESAASTRACDVASPSSSAQDAAPEWLMLVEQRLRQAEASLNLRNSGDEINELDRLSIERRLAAIEAAREQAAARTADTAPAPPPAPADAPPSDEPAAEEEVHEAAGSGEGSHQAPRAAPGAAAPSAQEELGPDAAA